MMRQLSLLKGDERFIFRYRAGQEVDVIEAFAELAHAPDSRFDWFDAALLAHQIGRRLEMELDQIV